MLQSIHAAILQGALEDLFTPTALNSIITANIEVDALWNQVGHDELHFDNNALEPSNTYIATQRALIRPSLETGVVSRAWQAFGRLTHTAQDFYSHTNYVRLWLATRTDGAVPPPDRDPST